MTTRRDQDDARLARTAIIALDVQNDVVHRVVPEGPAREALAARINRVTRGARAAGVPVIFVVTEFRAGYPCVPERNKGLSTVKAHDLLIAGTDGVRVIEGVDVSGSDVRVVKRRASAFVHGELPAVLSGLGAQHVVVFGVSTSGCVLSSVRNAADLDFRITVIEDCCADGDTDVHALLMSKIFPAQCDVLTAEAVCAQLEQLRM
jgi:nicotinamidase-related amidase